MLDYLTETYQNSNMKQDLNRLLTEALDLPAEERASLAGCLLDSLEPTVDEGCEEEWLREIGSRIRQVDSGKVTLIPWANVRARLLATQKNEQ